MDLTFPMYNGIAPSWADLKLTLGPQGVPALITQDVSSIKHGSQVTVGEQRGLTGGRVKKRTSGSVAHSGNSITFYRSGWDSTIERLAPVAPVRGLQRMISLVHFSMDLMFTPPGEIKIYHKRLKGVRLIGAEHAHEEGDDPDKVECAISVIEACDIINGMEIVLL
jgi:hypothetical protein